MSYRQVIRSTALMGGASGIVVVFRLLRVKILAAFLGPTGVGLFGMYTVMIDSVAGLAGLGVGSGAVREIASARASGDGVRLQATIAALRWLSIVLAVGGAAVLLAAPHRVADAAFGTGSQSGAVAWLSIGVALTVLTASSTGLIQGFGRVGDLARIDVFGAVVGSICGVSLLFLLGDHGVVGLVLAPAGASLVAALWFSRTVPMSGVRPPKAAVSGQARAILTLGLSLMGAGLAVSWGQLGLRSYITRAAGLDETGIYQAAWGITLVCIGFFLRALARDFYPRVSAAIEDPGEACVLVNEQVHVLLTLGGPILLAVMTFATAVISLVYAPSFQAAVPVLRWMILGNVLKLLSWPLGFVILAKGRGFVFLAVEVGTHLSLFVMAVIGYEVWGVTGTGVAFLLVYLACFPVLLLISHRLISYEMVRRNWMLAAALIIANAVILAAGAWSETLALGIGVFLTVVFSTFAWNELTRMLGRSPAQWILESRWKRRRK
jgi:PST family polysaccharide transporter